MEGLEKQAIRLMVVRMVVALTFFFSALGIQASIGLHLTLQPFFDFIAFVLALNLVYALMYWWIPPLRSMTLFLYIQLTGDAATVTLLVFLTGGIYSIFVFLFHLLIVVAGILLQRKGAFTMAAVDSLLFGSLTVALFYNWIRPDWFVQTNYEPPPPGSALYALLANLIGFFLVAVLVSIMSSRIERSRKTLGEVQKDLSFLRDLNEKVVSSLAGGLLTTDENWNVIFCNAASRRILMESVASGWNLLDQLRSLGLEEEVIDKLQDLNQPQDISLEVPGDQHLLVSLWPMLENEGRLGYLALVRDETELVRLRQQLALRDRLAATGEMAANIAHEIKNPLGSISGSAQMLRREAVPGSREYELLGIIHSESNRLSQTLQNFLSFVQPGPQILKSHDLVALAKEVWTLFRNDPSHSLEALTFKESFPSHEVVAAVDQDRFRQAMWNLLQNARKAVNGPGTITLSLSLHEPYAILEVKDTGKGIPKSEIPKYFEPFRRGFRSGSGLGLSVVYRIMEQHGGLVEMDSTYGKGTVCRLLFPLVRDDA